MVGDGGRGGRRRQRAPVYRWLARWDAGGHAGLLDRSSAPKRVLHRTPADRVRAIELLRRLRMNAAKAGVGT